jgi:hypothetical protein
LASPCHSRANQRVFAGFIRAFFASSPLLRDNILGSTFRASSLLYDFIDLRSTHDQSGRLHRSSNAGSSRRFRLVQKMSALNKEAEEDWGRRQKTPPVRAGI